jgi:hypothetical protein
MASVERLFSFFSRMLLDQLRRKQIINQNEPKPASRMNPIDLRSFDASERRW